jgi:nitrile hydratase
MNGAQDLGGQMGFGPVAPEIGEPLFHAAWEKRALALTLAAGAMGHWTIDESRHARESLHPVDYLSSSYYEIWTKALEVLLLRHGFVAREELASGQVSVAPTTPRRPCRSMSARSPSSSCGRSSRAPPAASTSPTW